jgi:hypothetical protein
MGSGEDGEGGGGSSRWGSCQSKIGNLRSKILSHIFSFPYFLLPPFLGNVNRGKCFYGDDSEGSELPLSVVV